MASAPKRWQNEAQKSKAKWHKCQTWLPSATRPATWQSVLVAPYLVLLYFQAISYWFSARKLLYHFFFFLLETSRCQCKHSIQSVWTCDQLLDYQKNPSLDTFIELSFSIISPINYVPASMSSVCIVNESGWNVRGWLSDIPHFCFWDSFPYFKLNLSAIKITSEIVWWPCVLLVQESPQSHFSSSYVSNSAFSNLRPSCCSGHWVAISYCDVLISKYFN